MAATTTLRVRPATRDRLNRLAKAAGVSAPDFLDRLVQREEEDRMLREMNEDFERLRQDKAAWEEFQRETALWDTTSGDTAAWE